MFSTPKFWDHKGILAHIMLPFSVIYFLLKRIIEAFKRKEKKFNFCSILVGNAVVGGAGKTPTCISIAKLIKHNFPEKKLCIVTKGYGGSITSPTLLDPKKHSFNETGDEPQILAKTCDVIIAKNRFRGAEFAEQNNYDVVIFDDGIHDRRIKKDFSLLVIDGKYGIGNGLVLPAGPLRDRLDITAKYATHILMIGKDEKKIIDKLKRRKIDPPVLKAQISNLSQPDKEKTYIAFAGIGRPQKFFDMLRFDMKLKLSETVEFPDHYNYEENDLNYIKSIAEKHKAEILTTEKDFVKFPDTFQKQCSFIEIELNIEDNYLRDALKKCL